MPAFDPDRVTTLTFDSYSTIVDVDAAAGALAEHVGDDVADPTTVAALWRAHSLFYTMAANFVDAYEPFYELNRHALTYALAAFDVEAPEAIRDEVLSVYMELDVFEDVREGMERLGEDRDLWVVSNGNPEMLEAMIDRADIADLLAGYVSADEIETYKPAAALYEHAAERADTPTDEVAHVTAGWFDVQGASHAGMQGVWVDRKGEPWVGFDGDPHVTVETFHELADELGV